MPVMTPGELSAFLAEAFPHSKTERYLIDHVGDGIVRLRYESSSANLRPGGTVSGPTLMGLSDMGMYLAVLAMIGPQPLAVTTNFNINFLRKPAPGVLTCEAKLLKLGKRLAVGEVTVSSDRVSSGPVSHATVTYSIPPSR